ncbi:hypothetical protein A5788_17720 [Gordonia sp. 852002-50816_SCH5313054-c]|uniref:hypothetical protein n=1 Tax=unclassified Gordonia (in: high G+C Gram-positive bacteria) TaxID=2657482 RepID=UPI0007EC28D9|nr:MULTISPECIES: hypothetical protein [unclassified Gordonia (in: high G+C Gram-positive bacteria)]OBC14035.1 hypothetical protein A5788_17720 [Gordonia sp. 852002-50816_SCH5313054-c]OBC14995.1 hypothetical protein A5786_21615 [Gordonia sp. 852002-50816_SCH5313054-a]
MNNTDSTAIRAASSPQTAPALVIDGVTKTFRSGNGSRLTAVDDLSLTIRPGEVVAFLGSSKLSGQCLVRAAACR